MQAIQGTTTSNMIYTKLVLVATPGVTGSSATLATISLETTVVLSWSRRPYTPGPLILWHVVVSTVVTSKLY